MTPEQARERMECASAWGSPNVRAFFAVMRRGEGTEGQDGYRRMFGGELFESFADHPRKVITRNGLKSTAAGVAQFLAKTWDDCAKALGLESFDPEAQRLAFVWLVRRRKALVPLVEGRFEEAVKLCNLEWASLPGSPYGQPTMTMDDARTVYEANGGRYAPAYPASQEPGQAPAKSKPQPSPAEPQKPAPERVNFPAGEALPPSMSEPPMSPFLPIALDAIFNLVPKLAKEFGSGSDVANRNIRVATTLVETAKKAVGAVNEQDIVEKLSSDPAAKDAIIAAVKDVYYELTEVGGGIAAAHERNTIYLEQGGAAFHKNPAFWVSCMFVLMVFLILVDMLFIHAESYSKDGLRTQIVTAILALVSGVAGYWLGSAFAQRSSATRSTDPIPPSSR